MAMAEVEVEVPALEPPQVYHAFIAHSSDDRDFAELLTQRLEHWKFKCFMYERDLHPGSNIIQGVVTNIDISRRVILIVTESFIASRWSVFEALQAVNKGVSENKVVLVPILFKIRADLLPLYLRPYRALDYEEDNFWNLLIKALVEDRPATALIPAGNVAHGLAWSYFYGFLNIVLPGMTSRSEKWYEEKEHRPEMLTKMLIVIPSSCWCPPKLVDLDPDHLSFEGYVEFSASRAGNIERNYKSSVYKVKDPCSLQEYLFIAEFATPILSMYEMESGGLAGLTKEEKVRQRMLFSDKLNEILSHPANRVCFNKATLMEYNDELKASKPQFSRLVCVHIRNELHKERQLQTQLQQLSLKPDHPSTAHVPSLISDSKQKHGDTNI